MIEKDDWRLFFGQKDNLRDKTLYFRDYTVVRSKGDHDHCEFCWDKFMDHPETLREGYTTEDNYYWICPTCFADFREMFNWTLCEDEE